MKRTESEQSSSNLWRDAWRRLIKNRAALVGLGLILVLALVAIAGDRIAPYSPTKQNYGLVFQGPSWSHWLGTDQLGRDLLSRMIHGTRVSLTVGVLVQVIVLGVGVPIGLVAGYVGGRVDNLLMRFTDVVYAFPDLLFIIIITTWLGRGIDKIFLAIGIVVWTDMARLVRGQTLSLREKEFVEAARAIGVPHVRIVLRHILPNALGPIIVAVTLGIPRAILAESALSFIGIGLTPPNASWGTLVQDAYSSIFAVPYVTLYPTLAIAITMLSFTFLGDGLRDALDPRMR
ncbi:MAG: ABC transporter permease [Chloroflexota bacterium]|nr:MAG: ABC transporter permease [Chloroflexota bacterium]